MDKTIEDKLAALQKLNDEGEHLKKLLVEFPDLKIHTDRWKHKRYMSGSVNSRADQWELGYSCGCCSDAAVYAWIFIETMGTRVYADPPRFVIGERYDYSGVLPGSHWKKSMQAKAINHEIIEAVERYLENKNPYADDAEGD